MAIAKVEPLTTARALRGPFDYRLPAEMSEVGVGSVLLVPFGPRRLLGVVVEVAESSELPPERLAEPIAAMEAGTPPELVRLGLWVGREYCSTAARGLELALPPGTHGTRGGAAASFELVAALTEAGRRALAGEGRLGRRQRAALDALAASDAERSAPELRAEAGVDRAALRRLEARGLVVLRTERRFRRPELMPVGATRPRPRLTARQAEAVEAIAAAMNGRGERELLLHGVTGSGKTEVYLAAAETALERGLGAIVLVPEIGLTPQTASRFHARFGDSVALLHSGLGAGQRRDEWERLRSGAARICVGPRSAIFAPIGRLGLIVIDEEHDASYKQGSDPRYDAREVARHRASEAGAALLAASATPRPESWAALARITLPERVDGSRLPAVELIDMRGRHPGADVLHPRTVEALAEVRDRGGKAIVLLNRRGWSSFLACRSCGRAWQCPRCDVSLVVHRREGRLRCHHCGHSEPLPDACPDCESVTLSRHGAGTERLVAVLEETLSPLPVFRFDSDATSGRGAHERVLRRFDEARSGVLAGTQMVGKGHDFGAVTLSVIVDADATLRFPDFRAEERTFAMVAQLAGRSGRGPGGGRVLVQTMAPGAEAIRWAAAHDAEGFVTAELRRRRALRYPPFSHLSRIELSGPDERRVELAAERHRDRVAEALPPGTEMLGPAPRFRVRGRHRRQLMLKAERRAETVAAIGEAVDRAISARQLRGVALSVDVDPQ